jgi:hypothetical protein
MLFLEASYNVLPTPSPEIGHPQVHAAQDLYPESWDALNQEYSATFTAGSKRPYDYTVDEFVTDVKKRRLVPTYDPSES